MEKDIKKTREVTNEDLAIMVAKGFESVEKRFGVVENKISNLELKLTTDIHDFRTDFKSFKKDTNKSIEKIEEDVADLADTDMHHDKRIEKLENKAFA